MNFIDKFCQKQRAIIILCNIILSISIDVVINISSQYYRVIFTINTLQLTELIQVIH